VIDTLSNTVLANTPIRQAAHAVVYVPGAVPVAPDVPAPRTASRFGGDLPLRESYLVEWRRMSSSRQQGKHHQHHEKCSHASFL
jgi:hypothetical protein